MSARNELIEIVTRDPISAGGDEVWATDLVDAYRAEVLATDGQSYNGELPMLRDLVRTLRVVVTDGSSAEKQQAEVRRLLHHHAADDAAGREAGAVEGGAV